MGSLKTNFLHGKKIQKLSGEDEDIKMVGMYSNPLFSLQLGKCSLHHASVSFQTKHIWDLVVNLKNYKVHLDSDLNRHKGPVRKYYNKIQRPVCPMAPKKGQQSNIMHTFTNIMQLTKQVHIFPFKCQIKNVCTIAHSIVWIKLSWSTSKTSEPWTS